MQRLPELGIAFLVSALLTLFDLDRTFYIPSAAKQKVTLYSWWWCFILANGACAAVLYHIFGNSESLSSINSWLRAALIGATYLALIRLKFTTFTFQGQEVPFGLEALYEGAKNFVYKRINRIAKAARYEETMAIANTNSLAQLASRAKISITQDAIMTAEEKRGALAWLLSVLQDQSSEDEKRAAVADFILSGSRNQ